jgi:hypothetical protein
MYYGMGVARPPFASDMFLPDGRRRWIVPGDFSWMDSLQRISYGFTDDVALLLNQRNPGLFIPTEIYNAGNQEGIADLAARAASLDPYELWNASAQAQTPIPADITIVGEEWYGNIFTHYAELEVPGHPELYGTQGFVGTSASGEVSFVPTSGEPYVETPSGELVPASEPNASPNQPSAVTQLPVTEVSEVPEVSVVPEVLTPPEASTGSNLSSILAIGGAVLLASGFTAVGIGALALAAFSSKSTT